MFKQDDKLVVDYVNFDYAGDLDNCRSTTSYTFTFYWGLVSLKSILQAIVALLTMEVKYMAGR